MMNVRHLPAALLAATFAAAAHTCLAQQGAQATAPAAPQKREEAKRYPLPPPVFVRAGREKIYATRAEQMKEQGYALVRKDEQKIVFTRRTPGAAAAVRRGRADRTVTSPIVDAPTQTLAFVLTERGGGFVVAARMIATELLPGADVYTYDASRLPAVHAGIRKDLERLKAAAEDATR